MTNNLPENFCSVAWLQIHSEPDGDVSPCCYFDIKKPLGNWGKEELITIYNNEQWNQLRKDFMDNKRPVQCTKCWKEEDANVTSMRQRFNQKYQTDTDTDLLATILDDTNSDGSVNKVKLGTIDLTFNNLCNFSCRSCGPYLSTNWYSDSIKLNGPNPRLSGVIDATIAQHRQSDLEYLIDGIAEDGEIHFSGGEPLMQKEHYEILKLLIAKNKTKVRIRYNTNLSIQGLGDQNVFDLLEKFDNVYILGSIDAIGKQGEYIRKGFDWELALDWLTTAKKRLPKSGIGISTVYSLLNCYAAIDLCKYVFENRLAKNGGYHLNMVHAPSYYRTCLLPKHVKEDVTAKINELIAWLEANEDLLLDLDPSKMVIGHWQNAINFMNSSDESSTLSNFFTVNKKLDAIRDESFEEVFPELFASLNTAIEKKDTQ
jgi:radical SAM protein with 4Fe4S-binding SPASM domain